MLGLHVEYLVVLGTEIVENIFLTSLLQGEQNIERNIYSMFCKNFNIKQLETL